MNHLIDTDEETIDSKHLKLLEILIDKSIKRLQDKSCKPRIQDALKAIQLKQKMARTSEAEKIFWQEIEAIRNEELSKLYPKTLNLESQILNIIIELKQLVKNGILPVKIITDTFNQGKSKESQLSYRRIGQLLSSMGFRKAKTHAGTYAILWDDQLLSQNTFSNREKNEKLSSAPPASPACPANSPIGSGVPISSLTGLREPETKCPGSGGTMPRYIPLLSYLWRLEPRPSER